MIHNFVSGKLIIGKIYDEFNVKSRDWENRAPRWIADALGHLNIYLAWEEVVEDIPFEDYKFKLPCNLKALRGIIVDRTKLNKTTSVSHKVTNKEVGDFSHDNRYYNVNSGYVELEIESGIAKVIYKKLPLEWDDKLNMWIPLVPDIPDVIDNIAWYVLKLILARGYIHPIYSLTSNSEYNNPDVRWTMTKRAARMRAKSMDTEDRRRMAEQLSTFLVDPRADINELFTEHHLSASTLTQQYGWQDVIRREDLLTINEEEE